jgi:hypothetical protein
MATRELTLKLLRPHQQQQHIIDNAARFNVVPCGRRFGKTTLGIQLLATPETLPHPQAWLSPTYKMLLEVWREVEQRLAPIVTRRSIQERRLELLTGGVIEFWSMDNDVARGRKYRRVIVDEAGMVPGLMDAWNYSIRPTLADLSGDAFFFGTPKGRNDFWRLFQMANDSHNTEWAAFSMASQYNPHVPPAEFEAMQASLPERVYQQEILAAFLEDGGGVFRGVMRAVDGDCWQDEPIAGHQFIMGVDWGKHSDFTVLTVIDVTLGHVCHIDRFNQIDYSFQVQRLKVLADKFRPAQIIAEQNSMGDPIIEQLRIMQLPVTPFVTTNATKKAAIEALSLAFERDEIRIPDDAVLIGELQAYELEQLPSGNVRYNAPSGMHDDAVMSLAIGWSGMGQGFKVW